MVLASGAAPAPSSLPLDPGAPRKRPTGAAEPTESTGSASSFEGQLAAVIEKYLGQSENGSRIEIKFQNGEGQNSGARQFVVTVLEPGAEWRETATPTAAQASAPELSPSQMLMYSGTVEYKPQAVAEAQEVAPTNVVDAYWATQPPEVRELRYIESEAKRTERAQELAAQGFAIDVPIMVWQWEPFMTMRARELAGYTWVPSANNAPVALGPGLSFPGMAPYDANNPPPGSIRVTTEFARGLEHTSIWWRPGIFVAPESAGA